MTGVQTCALPISDESWYSARLDSLGFADAFSRTLLQPLRDKIASLVPSSDTRLSLSVADEVYECVMPRDWLNISDEELLIRIESQNKTVPLYPLLDKAGKTVGRVGLGISFSHEILLTHAGVRCGWGTHFAGLLTWSGAKNAARSEPKQGFASFDWRPWAQHMLTVADHADDQDDLATIHQVMPDNDISILRMANKYYSLEELVGQLAKLNKFAVFHEHLSANDDDGVVGRLFGAEFDGAEDCVFFPPFLYPMEFLRIPTIDYWTRLRIALRGTWQNWDESDHEEFQIGAVAETAIIRRVKLFSRT